MDLPTQTTTFVNKVPQTIPDQHFILKTEWHTNNINLQILDTHRSKEWQGNVRFDDLKQSSEELEIPYEKFFDECKEALTTNGGAKHFEYVVENDKFNLIKKDQFQIQYLELDLTTNPELKSDFGLAAVDLIASLRAELSQCKESTKELNEKYQTMVSTVEKCLEEKNQLEKNLLNKFALLLNSKKDKIAELQDLLVEKNRLLEDAGISPEETTGQQEKKNSTDCDANDNDDDFLQPTQVMTQPVSKSLPKRVKLGS
ncbi:uncharacterized protein LOC129910224 [Episyrphus balteatus]|uniref:uncharacterized protein LOC129910224 n=1 Tax=Episyrphus balteatus TaxID=286459 RepID=UPI0024850D6E|nr:uncharacterized protein LOC129910224 [Episyrphus balteatus]